MTEIERRNQGVLGRILRARLLHHQHGEGLRTDPTVEALLAAYRESLVQTGVAMQNEGIGEACSLCADKNPSGCCFVGIEDGYDEILLLLNLLLDCHLPESPHQPESCFFVGPAGCTLAARYYFCLHYFCPELEASLGDRRIRALQEQVARELSIGSQLERAVRAWLKDPCHASRDEGPQ